MKQDRTRCFAGKNDGGGEHVFDAPDFATCRDGHAVGNSDHRAGASGTLGVEAASRITANGYTFLASPNAPMVLLSQLRKVRYLPRDFRPIAAVGEYVYGWAVLPSLGMKNVAELVALAKLKPGKLTFSVPGIGTATHFRGEALNILAGM